MRFDHLPVWRKYDYRPPHSLQQGGVESVPILIVGGGPIGLAIALDLAQKGHPITLLNALPFITRGSKAICFSKRTLDIWDRLGVAERLVDKGVIWEKGKVFWGAENDPIYEFDLLPVKDQKNPAFINLQQYYTEEYFLDALEAYPEVDIRWQNEVVAIDSQTDGARVTVQTPDGDYQIHADYVLACDGSRSPVRHMLGLDFQGRVFEDNFLIADVKFKQQRPAERWFRFDPPYPGDSSLIHKQPDGIWRLDFQLGWDIDKKEAVKVENVDPFVKGFLGPDVEYEYEWISVYTFQCRRMDRFVHDRIIFAGDSAHLVSPFGARGCNGGYADVDNLAWKLDLILRGKAGDKLLESYNHEAVTTADENILNSSRSTDFMTPKTQASRTLRDAVLTLSRHHKFARPFVNSGRLSTPVSYPESPLNTTNDASFDAGPGPGQPCVDAPVSDNDGDQWLLSQLGNQFVLLCFCEHPPLAGVDKDLSPRVRVLWVSRAGADADFKDPTGLAHERYGVSQSGFYLVRPDQYVAARWDTLDLNAVSDSLRRAQGF